MAKTKGPLFSLEARGTVGGLLTYQKVFGINRVGIKNIPTDGGTPAQLANRLVYGQAVTAWRDMSEEEQQSYDDSVKNLELHMTGFNFFLQEYFYVMLNPITPPEPPAPEIVTDQLANWWKFLDNLNDSVGSMHLSLTGPNFSYEAGRFYTKNAHFGGATYLSFDSAGEMGDASGNITYDFWMRPDSTTDPEVISSRYIDGSHQNCIYFRDYSPFNRMLNFSLRTASDPFPYPLALGEWVHICMVVQYSPSKVVSLYLNGVFKESDSFSGDSSAGNFYLGCLTPGYGQYLHDSSIDSFKVYKKCLSAAEVLQNYEAETVV